MKTCMSAQMEEVLLGYLQATYARWWPGTEGMTMQDALLSYPRAIASGQVPDQQDLLKRHPDLVGELEAYFSQACLDQPRNQGDIDWLRYLGVLEEVRHRDWLTVERETNDNRPSDVVEGVLSCADLWCESPAGCPSDGVASAVAGATGW